MIRIISDSTCDLSKELIEKYNITVVPLHIVLGEEEFFDGVNITSETFSPLYILLAATLSQNISAM